MTSLPHKGAHACTHMRLSTDIFSPTQHTHTKKKGRGIKIYRRKISKTAVRFEPTSGCSTTTLSCKALPSVFHLSKGGGAALSTCAALWVGRDDVRRTVTACHSDLRTDMPVGALEPLVNGCFGDTAGIIKALMGFLCMSCLTQLLGKSVIPRHLCRKKKKKSKKTKLSLILESHHALGTEKRVESGWESPKLTLQRSSF